MNWIVGNQDYYCADYLKGMVMTFPDKWRLLLEERNSAALARVSPPQGRPALIISGGGANGPMFPGYVGEGLADAAVIGGPYSAPTAYALYETARQLDCGHGVLLLYNNFAGDYLNNDMAQELLEMIGIRSVSVIVKDDIASAVGEDREERSGRTGLTLLTKLASSCLEKGYSLTDTVQMLERAKKGLATVSIRVDVPTGMVYYGEGISGEPGIKASKEPGLEAAAKTALDMLLSDLQPERDASFFLLVNRMRSTSYSDSYAMARHSVIYLKNIYDIWRVRTGCYSNITDGYGFDLTLLTLNDEMKGLLEKDIQTDCFII